MIDKELLIFIPCYNERDNVEALTRRIRALAVAADLFFIDDDSPDGTGVILDRLAEQDKALFVRHRPGRRGIGSAHLEALNFAYDRGYRRLITLDADLTHSPEMIPAFLERSGGCDLVIGSRFLNSRDDRRPCMERWASRISHLATWAILKLPFDATGAYRLYRLDRIDRRLFSRVTSTGFAFFFESLAALHAGGVVIGEIPVRLTGRKAGKSKMRLRDALSWCRQLIGRRRRCFSAVR